MEQLGQAVAPDRLEAGGRVERDAAVGGRDQAQVDVGLEAVGRRGLVGAVRLVQSEHAGAAGLQGTMDRQGERAQATEVPDDDPPALEGRLTVAQPLDLPHDGHGRAGGRPALQALEGADRLRPADAVGRQLDVALELGQRVGGVGTEDPVHPPGVEAEATEPALQLGHVVTPEVGAAQLERPVAEHPAGLDQRVPRDVVAHAVRGEAVIVLERGDRGAGLVAVVAPAARGPARSRRPSAAAGGPGPHRPGHRAQGELGTQAGAGRNSLSSWSSALLGLAPTSRLATSPSLKTSRVGMLITL